MQESGQAALSYVRSKAETLGLEKDFYQKVDLHIHVPEGGHTQRRTFSRYNHGYNDCISILERFRSERILR